MKKRRPFAVLLMVGGPLLSLSSPWLVFSLPPIRNLVYDQMFVTATSGCTMVEYLNDSAALEWVSALCILGILTLFAGLWLFYSARFQGLQYVHGEKP